MILLIDDLLQVPDLRLIEVLRIVLAASHVLKLVNQTSLKFILQFLNFLLSLNLEGIFLFMKHRDLPQQFFQLRLMRILLHLDL